MWPYVASAAVAFASHAATTNLIFPLAMTLPVLGTSQPPHETPHDVDSHKVSLNALRGSTSSATHQPRSWSKAKAPSNILSMFLTLSTAQPPMSRLK